MTNYKIVTIQVEANASLDDADITDGLNEVFRACCQTGEGIVDDWQFITAPILEHLVVSEYEIRRSSDTPEEGELFELGSNT